MNPQFQKPIQSMALIVQEMVTLIYQGFMENDKSYFDSALNKERALDNLEKSVTADIVEYSKSSDKDAAKELIVVGQVALHLERMGDEFRYLMERIEIKIAENLYFSDEGVVQYREVFAKMQRSVNLIADFLNAYNNACIDQILVNGLEIKDMIERYRLLHIQRVTKGMCNPMAANMFFDMLDFTGNVARHCTNIGKLYKGN